MYRITVGFSPILYCWPYDAITIGEPDLMPWRVFDFLCRLCSHLNVLTISPLLEGVLRKSRCVQILLTNKYTRSIYVQMRGPDIRTTDVWLQEYFSGDVSYVFIK